MGTEYYIIDNDKKEYYELGKGGWSHIFNFGKLNELPESKTMTSLFLAHTYAEPKCDWEGAMIKILHWCDLRENLNFESENTIDIDLYKMTGSRFVQAL